MNCRVGRWHFTPGSGRLKVLYRDYWMRELSFNNTSLTPRGQFLSKNLFTLYRYRLDPCRYSLDLWKFYTCSHCPSICIFILNHYAQNARIFKNGVPVQKWNRSTCLHCAGTTWDHYGSKTGSASRADTKLAWIGGPKLVQVAVTVWTKGLSMLILYLIQIGSGTKCERILKQNKAWFKLGSSNSHFCLAWNSHALSATIIDSHDTLSSNLNLLKFFLRVINNSHLARGDDSRWELKKTLMRANSRQLSSLFCPWEPILCNSLHCFSL